MVDPAGVEPTSLVCKTRVIPVIPRVEIYGGQSRTRTYEPRREEIYSLQSLPLDYLAILLLEHETGIEPALSAWKAEVLAIKRLAQLFNQDN